METVAIKAGDTVRLKSGNVYSGIALDQSGKAWTGVVERDATGFANKVRCFVPSAVVEVLASKE